MSATSMSATTMPMTSEYPQSLEISERAIALTFTANGEYLISGGHTGVRVWGAKDGKLVVTMTEKPTICIAASNDGRWIAGASLDLDEAKKPVASELLVWDATTYEQVLVDKFESAVIFDMDFSPDSSCLVGSIRVDTGRETGRVIIWDIATRRRVRTLHDGQFAIAKYSPLGDRVATATRESIQVWDSNDGRSLVDVKVGIMSCLPVWRNDHLFVVAKNSSKIKEIDATTGSVVSEWAVPDADHESCLALPQHGKFIACATTKAITFWDITTHAQFGYIPYTRKLVPLHRIAFSPDGQLFAIAESERIVIKDLASVFPSVSEPELDIDSTALDAWKHGQLADAEASLSAAIPTSKNTHHTLASRALIRARSGQWDAALVDAEKSIKIQRSVIGYIAKCVALVGKGETDRGCGVCDIASFHFPSDHTSFLLIKVVVLFMAGKHVDAISRLDDFITDAWVDPVLNVVQAHMRFLLGNKFMESSDHEHAIRAFEDARIKLGNCTRRPPLIVSLVSGWRFDDLFITIQQHLCEALFSAGRTEDAGRSMLRMVGQAVSITEHTKMWVSDFKGRCRSKLEALGDSSVNATRYDEAIAQYTAALSLDPAGPQDLLMKRSNAWVGKGMREDALRDTKEWTRLMLASGSWKDGLTTGVGFMLERFSIYQALCEHLEATSRITDAVACFHQMSSELAMEKDGEQVNWARGFKSRCRSKLEALGDSAAIAKEYDEAISQYTVALSLDPPTPQHLFVKRSKSCAGKGLWKDALKDAEEVIKLDPSSSLGYESKYRALCGAGHFVDATDAFETMLAKISESPDPETRKRSRHYVRPEATREVIRTAIQNAVRQSPPVLINAISGRLCSKSQQISAFESMPIFTELICSMTTHIDHALIVEEVGKFYRYATLSHTWEGDEPLYEKVVKIVVYDLEASPMHDKLQMFCKIVRDEGFFWAWSDTCCINKGDHFVLQEALVRMFKWYEGSAVTIIFLYDVDQLAELDALMRSKWNSRGWTLQEYHASKVVRIYTKDWKPYLGLTIYNHKESPEIISEMEKATGISAESLKALRPGLNNIREKLRLASSRQTTRVEDAAYSLLGIFSTSLPVTYGEEDKALGRLLSQLLMSSGDTSILAWSGESGSFNSCLPMSIVVFSQPLTFHIPPTVPDAEMETIIAEPRAPRIKFDLVTRLYDRLSGLHPPTFSGQRMRLPCLAFGIKLLSRRRVGSEFVFHVRAGVLGTVDIKTEQNFTLEDSLYLVYPWLDFLLDRRDSGRRAVAAPPENETSESDDFVSFDSSPQRPGASPASLRRTKRPPSLPTLSPTDIRTRAYKFLARLRQPFGALLLTSNPQNEAEYSRVSTKSLITVQVGEITPAMLNALIESVRELDVL